MYMRAITIRIAYVAVLSAGIVLAAAARQSEGPATPVPPAAAQPQVAASPLPLVTLPAVHVRAAAPPARLAKSQEPLIAARTEARVGEGHTGGGSLPSLRLDMPYYSFGKLLPRVGKE